jgi:hypothetical protein
MHSRLRFLSVAARSMSSATSILSTTATVNVTLKSSGRVLPFPAWNFGLGGEAIKGLTSAIVSHTDGCAYLLSPPIISNPIALFNASPINLACVLFLGGCGACGPVVDTAALVFFSQPRSVVGLQR